MGYESIEIQGCALKYFTTPDKSVYKYVLLRLTMQVQTLRICSNAAIGTPLI
jgi:hypothetical protein